ncbi:MAG: MnmC family methyltransferase, partial [Thalassobaculaceae bacterium]
MRANTQKAQRFFRPKSPEPVSDLPVDLDPEISFHNDGKFFSKKRNEFYLADPNVIYSQQNNFFNHKLFEEKKKAKDIFSFGEIGFGLGLNFIIILKNWSKVLGATKRLHYFAIESFPLSKDNLKIAKQRFPDLANEYQELIDKYPPIHTGFHRIWLKSSAVALTLIFEPTWRGISQIEGKFDAWFLSQFSNESAPDQWSPDIFSEISRLSRKDTLICSSNTGAYVDGELKRIGYEVVG